MQGGVLQLGHADADAGMAILFNLRVTPGSDNKDVNMALVTYNIRPDNAKLGSFGSIADGEHATIRVMHFLTCAFMGAQADEPCQMR